MAERSKRSQSAPAGYAPLLADLKARVRAAQVRAALSVNRELILLYWHIGREILRCQHDEGWGEKVVERLVGQLPWGHNIILKGALPSVKDWKRNSAES